MAFYHDKKAYKPNEVSVRDSVLGTKESDPNKKTVSYLIGGITGLVLNNLGLILTNRLIHGSISWISGYTFNVSPLTYALGNSIYNSVGGQITLNPASETQSRIDVIVVDTNGELLIIEGEYSLVAPIKPTVNLNAYVEVSFVLVKANTTEPEDPDEITTTPYITEEDLIDRLNNYTLHGGYTGTAQDLYDLITNTSSLETIINGYYVLTEGKTDLENWQVGDKFRGWNGDEYVVGKVVGLPFDINDRTKVKLAINNMI